MPLSCRVHVGVHVGMYVGVHVEMHMYVLGCDGTWNPGHAWVLIKVLCWLGMKLRFRLHVPAFRQRYCFYIIIKQIIC